jgi:hypothetical protein
MQLETEWEIQGTLFLGDVVRFCYFDLCRRLPPVLVVACALAAAVGLLLLGELTGNERRLLIEAAAFCFVVVPAIALSIPYRKAKRQYARQHCLQELMKFDFTEEGVELEGPSVFSTVPWSRVRRIYETGTAFFLDQGLRSGWLLPKRFFVDEADIQAWRVFVLGQLDSPNAFRGLTWLSSFF